MIAHGDRVVVAVSGGPDSVCLLRALLALAPEYALSLHVAHLDHRFRGAGSSADAAFVRSLAKDLGIDATIESIDVPAYCAERGLSAQAGAREVRYRFLRKAAAETGAARIALGHTANDQAETLLMRLIRGAGLSGLAGIPPVREEFVRPLIDCSRSEVLDHLRELGQDFRTDPSNQDPAYTRNRVRSEVLPLLERFNPQAVDALAAEADILREENAVLDELAAGHADRLFRPDAVSVRLSRQAFLELPPALQRRLLRGALDRLVCGPPHDLSWVRSREALAFMAEAQSGRTMALPCGLVLSREHDDLVIGSPRTDAGFCEPLAVPGTTAVGAAGLLVTAEVLEGPAPVEKENNLWQAQFDYDKIALPLCLRSRRVGDRFRPEGMDRGTKKLQDLFVDAKVPQGRRGSVPVLASQDEVLWVVGMRRDGRFLPGPGTKKVLRIMIQKDP